MLPAPVAQALLPVLFIERSIAEKDFSTHQWRDTAWLFPSSARLT
jgi:hypothetical protein